eukprot:s9004_g2.t1
MMSAEKDVKEVEEGPKESFGGCDSCSGVSCTPDGLIGLNTYDWKYLCIPSLPCFGPAKSPPLLKPDSKLPLMLSLIMGLQHALAMLGGIITPPSLISGDACFAWQLDQELACRLAGETPQSFHCELCDSKQYMISAALICSGLLSLVQILRWKLIGGYTLGTGLISVIGTSFTFLPIAREVVVSEIQAGRSGMDAYGKFLGTCLAASVTELFISFVPPREVVVSEIQAGRSGMDAYGKFLGTCLAASVTELFISFVPPRYLKKIFPPVVSGTCVCLIGAGLSVAGLKYWGGGVFCAENDMSRAAAFGAPQVCTGNGDVALPYGDVHYFGLGLSVMIFLVFIQAVGSPFMKNCSVALALFFGFFVAGVSSYTAEDGTSLPYVNGDKIEQAGVFTFLWTAPFLIQKFGAAIASIPDAVLGGMTTFLFANVLVSGINIVGGSGQMGRRTRFILAVSLGVGVGVAALPNWAEGGGLAGFHGGNLKHNIGLWPAKDGPNVFLLSVGENLKESGEANM